jgi:hypothetical protein
MEDLVKYLNDNPSDFKRKLTTEHKYTVSQNGNYYLFYYGHPKSVISKESRGIILYKNEDKWEIACRPFDNFITENGDHRDFDWASARIFEKIDGSLVKLWYHNDKWHVSSNAAIKNTKKDFVWVTEELLKIADHFEKDRTHMFELLYRNRPSIIYLASRNNETGEMYYDKLDFKKFGIWSRWEYFNVGNMDYQSVREFVDEMGPHREGVVCVDKHGNQLKIKNF